MERSSPVKTRSRPRGRWSALSSKRTTGFDPTDAIAGGQRRPTRSSLQTAAGTTPDSRGHPDEPTLPVLMPVLIAVLLAQGEPSPVKSQDRSSAPDARQIMEASIAATQRDWKARLHYTYIERDENRRRDLAGRVKSEDVEVSRMILVNGVPFEQLVERNGQPPSAGQERKQQRELDKLKRETPEQRAERLRKQEEENTSIVQEVPKAFDFQVIGEEAVNGRPAYILQATPHPGYHAQGKYGNMFSKVTGKLWVDTQDLGWIKVDGQVIQPFSMGLFLVRLLRGAHITMEQTRVDDGIWMPERIEVRATAKIFFVKSLVIDRILIFSEYTLPQVGVAAARKSVIP